MASKQDAKMLAAKYTELAAKVAEDEAFAKRYEHDAQEFRTAGRTVDAGYAEQTAKSFRMWANTYRHQQAGIVIAAETLGIHAEVFRLLNPEVAA